MMKTREKILIPFPHKRKRRITPLQSLLLIMGVAVIVIPFLHKNALFLIDRYVTSLPYVSENMLNYIYSYREKLVNETVEELEVDPITADVEVNDYSVEMFRQAGVAFPEIHFIMHFKETSFCRPISRGIVSLCTDDLIDIIGFNPNNGSGMKHPHYRPTKSLGSIGDVIKQRGIKLDPKYKKYYKDPHAVFATPFEHCLDIAMWQNYWFSRKGEIPDTEEEYIEFLRKVGYNPYSKYYDNPRSGLYALYNMYLTGKFQETYDKYLIERMGYSMKQE